MMTDDAIAKVMEFGSYVRSLGRKLAVSSIYSGSFDLRSTFDKTIFFAPNSLAVDLF